MKAVAQFFNNSLLVYDNNEYTIALFLDVSREFDMIGHKVRLKKIQ